MNHPMQPIHVATDGVIRFRGNAIVRLLLDWCSARGLTLNDLAVMPFSDDDFMQLAQLLGYSVSGFGDLSYADPDTVQKADAIAAELREGKR